MLEIKDRQLTISHSSIGLYILFGMAAIIFPVILWKMNLPIISYTYGKDYQVFELFGFFASVVLIFVAYFEIRKQRGGPPEKLYPLLIWLLVSFHFLILVSEHSIKSWDYGCYENAARLVLKGENPYLGTYYLYPPLSAQIMALFYRCGESLTSFVKINTNPKTLWYIIFYLYQCAQFMLVTLLYLLCYRLTKNLRMKELPASILVAAVFLFNNPLFRTLRWNQVNLWVLSLILVALLFSADYPWLAGLSLAFATHIKVYPILLLLPLLIMRDFRTVMWLFVGLVGIFLLQTNFGQNFELWGQFSVLGKQFPQGIAFRDNSLHSVIRNSFKAMNRVITLPHLNFIISGVTRATTLGIVSWFVIRFLKREKSFRIFVSSVSEKGIGWANILRSYGHFIDSIALMLLISPMVWEHHYVLAIPVVLCAIIIRGRDKPWQIGIGAFLMLTLPTFDIFPLSYHRLAGLLVLTRFAPPSIKNGI